MTKREDTKLGGVMTATILNICYKAKAKLTTLKEFSVSQAVHPFVRPSERLNISDSNDDSTKKNL
jgi:hypothetical protein